MSALAQQTAQHTTTVTSIDANARVDYILRFSKHVVLVLDELDQQYAQVSSQFLASLPEHHNAAYLSVSPKFNDIQIRCRIIEQFFPDTPFDPEQSLSISILELAKQKSTPLSLVVEHCQHISLQILHELCQLAEAAKRIEREVNVVLTGTIEIGRLVALNQVLFNQKISMVSVQTGQLISPKSEIFKAPASIFSFGPYKKFFVLFTCLCTLGALTIWGLYQRENHTFSGLNNLPFIKSISFNDQGQDAFIEMPEKSLDSEASLIENKQQDNQFAESSLNESNLDKGVSANADEIVSAIAQSAVVKSIELEAAETSDIYHALLVSHALQEDTPEELAAIADDMKIINDIEELNAAENFRMNTSDYYTQLDFGYVVQYATISYQHESEIINKVEKFTQPYEDFIFKHYRRLINGQKVIVITSEFYTDKQSAKLGLTDLPSSLKKQSPWIKSISAVKQEIEGFKSSQ